MCKATVTYSGNTSNLTYHIQHVHLCEYRDLLGDHDHSESGIKTGASGEASHAIRMMKQPTLHATITKAAPYPQDSSKHKQLVDATAEFIYHSLQPLSIVDEPSFIAEPRYQLPHRTHFTEKVLPNKYREVRAVVEKQLGSVQKCTMTTDLWTSQHQHHSYTFFTVHFIDS